MEVRKRKITPVFCLMIGIFLSFLGLFTFSITQIAIWAVSSLSASEQIASAQERTPVAELPDTIRTKIINPPADLPPADPYWDYIKMNLIDVDFTDLKSTNPDVAAWLQVGGTNINYPVVQASNNSFYLNHSLDKSYNNAGWVFLDSHNHLGNFEQNTIIYAHGRTDQTMFGSLRKILTSGWLNTPENYIVKLSTEYENTLWQVFSVYRIPTTGDYLSTTFVSDGAFLRFADTLKTRSAHDFQTAVAAADRILTLSTCYDDHDKVVLHAKLIKQETRLAETPSEAETDPATPTDPVPEQGTTAPQTCYRFPLLRIGQCN